MRVPSITPPPLPQRVESPTPLTEVAAPDAPGWQEAAEALDAMTPSTADESDSSRDHENDDAPERRGVPWATPEEDDDASPIEHEAARRPDLGNGFWVLPEPRSPLQHVHAQIRTPLIAEPSRTLPSDMPGQRHARHGFHDGDDDARQDEDAGQDDGRADP